MIDKKHPLIKYLEALEKLTFYLEEKHGLRIINTCDSVDKAIEIMKKHEKD